MALPVNGAKNIIDVTAQLYATRQQYALTQIDAAMQLRTAKTVQRVDTGPSAAEIALQDRQIKLLTLKDNFADELQLLANTDAALSFIKTELEIIKTELQTLGPTSTPAERATAAANYTTMVDKINDRVNGTAVNGKNLIGHSRGTEFATDDVSTAYGKANQFLLLDGQFLGVGTFLTDGATNTYAFNRIDDTLDQYNPYPDNPTGTTYNLVDLVVSNFDVPTDTVTFSAPVPLTATLTRGGLGILDVTLYENFDNDTAVARAITDIDAAIDKIVQAQPTFGLANANLENANRAIDNELDIVDSGLKAKINERLVEEEAIAASLETAYYGQTYGLQLSAGSLAALVDFIRPTEIDRTAMGVLGYVTKD